MGRMVWRAPLPGCVACSGCSGHWQAGAQDLKGQLRASYFLCIHCHGHERPRIWAEH